MATRFYLSSVNTAVGIQPTTFNFGDSINPLLLVMDTTKDGSALTTKTEATGTTNPTARAMFRFISKRPLAAQTISGTIKGQMRWAENNTGADATPAIAVKIVKPDGTDRAILLAQTASDSATAGHEIVLTTLTNAQFQDAAESASISLTSQDASAGDYLVIEIGFRSATGTTRNISASYGSSSATDLAEDTSTTTANNPWVEFSGTVSFQTPVAAYGMSQVPVFWLKSDAGVFKDIGITAPANTETVELAVDQSLNGNNYINTTAGSRPRYDTNALNSLPGMHFLDGSPPKFLLNPALGFTTTDFEIILVVNSDTGWSNFASWFAEYSGTSADRLYLGEDSTGTHRVAISRDGTSTASSIWDVREVLQAPRAFGFSSPGASGGNITVTIWKNGLAGTTTATVTGISQTAATCLGAARGGTSTGHSGYIYEAACFSPRLSVTDRQLFYAGINSKWGIGDCSGTPDVTNGQFYEQATSPQIILTKGSGAEIDASFAEIGTLLKSGTNYYLHYSAWNAAVGKIGYAKGTTLGALTKQGAALSGAGGGAWDSAYVCGQRIMKDPVNGKYWLYYFGSQTASKEGAPSSIGVAWATTLDGPWTRSANNPLLTPVAAWEATQLYRPGPFYNPANGTYYLFYNAAGSGVERIGVATGSTPEGPFTKYAGNPIMTVGSTGKWDDQRIGDPQIILSSNGKAVLNYYGGMSPGPAANGIAVANLSDLTTWTKYGGNPVDFGDPSSGTDYTGLVRADWLADSPNYIIVLDDVGTNIYAMTGPASPSGALDGAPFIALSPTEFPSGIQGGGPVKAASGGWM